MADAPRIPALEVVMGDAHSVAESRISGTPPAGALPLTAEMLRLAQPGGRLTVSTAYLNLARPFHRALASASKVSVLSEVMKSSRQLPV